MQGPATNPSIQAAKLDPVGKPYALSPSGSFEALMLVPGRNNATTATLHSALSFGMVNEEKITSIHDPYMDPIPLYPHSS